MKVASYLVIPEAGNPHGYFLINREKNLKLYVKKVFEDDRRTAYYYRFTHLDAQGRQVSPAAYADYALNKGLGRADNEQAARWFLTQYFSFRELHYAFASILGSAPGSYYPVLCRKVLQHSDFELNWE
jgi:hypothetical protein